MKCLEKDFNIKQPQTGFKYNCTSAFTLESSIIQTALEANLHTSDGQELLCLKNKQNECILTRNILENRRVP